MVAKLSHTHSLTFSQLTHLHTFNDVSYLHRLGRQTIFTWWCTSSQRRARMGMCSPGWVVSMSSVAWQAEWWLSNDTRWQRLLIITSLTCRNSNYNNFSNKFVFRALVLVGIDAALTCKRLWETLGVSQFNSRPGTETSESANDDDRVVDIFDSRRWPFSGNSPLPTASRSLWNSASIRSISVLASAAGEHTSGMRLNNICEISFFYQGYLVFA